MPKRCSEITNELLIEELRRLTREAVDFLNKERHKLEKLKEKKTKLAWLKEKA